MFFQMELLESLGRDILKSRVGNGQHTFSHSVGKTFHEQ